MVRKLVVHPPTSTVWPRPNDGSQCRMTEKNRIKRMPIKKVGSDTPINDTACSSRLDQWRG